MLSTFVGPVMSGVASWSGPLGTAPLNGVVVTFFVVVTVYLWPEPDELVQSVFSPPTSLLERQVSSGTRTSIVRRLQRTDSPGTPVGPGTHVAP